MKKNKLKIDVNHLQMLPYRIDGEQFEYLARLAYDAGRKWSIQRVIDSRVFDRMWRAELEELRHKHRKLRLKDTQFYQTWVLKKMGIKPRIGRPFHRPRKMKK